MSEKSLPGGTFFRRPLPSLAQWLGDGTRGDEFEEWVSDCLAMELSADPQTAMAVRLLRTMSIAALESARIEIDRHGGYLPTVMLTLARVTGIAIMSANLSVLDADKKPPLPKIARVLAEEFLRGARLMIEGSAGRGE